MAISRCTVSDCKWKSPDTWRHIAGCYATWHVYEEHPEIWKGLFGDRPPLDPDPRKSEGMAVAIIESALSGSLG